MTPAHPLPCLHAYIWWCGDEECDCTQPVLDIVYPNPNCIGWVRRLPLWKGEFHSEATSEETEKQVAQLTKIAKKKRVDLDDDYSGYRVLSPETVKRYLRWIKR